MSEHDVWIEAGGAATEETAQFFRFETVPTPQYGAHTGQTVVKFNLTAYVRHMIEQAKPAPKPCIFEARSTDGRTFGVQRAWCQTHGFDCPQFSAQGGENDATG